MSEFQLVLQWDAEVETPDDLGEYYRHKMAALAAGHLDSDDVLSIENLLENLSGGLYHVDGHDQGCGTINVFLNTDDLSTTIERVISEYESGKFRRGMRIGVERPGGYRAVYPAGSESFVLWDMSLFSH